ncbi:MAG: NAD(P)H-hydrate dehydratase [Oscillospiraceae bacterium]
MKYINSAEVWAAIPIRAANTHKGSYGKAMVVAGCEEYRGAAALAVLGALRVGAGLVTLAAAETVIASVASRILEATFLPLPSKELYARIKSADATLIGCGMHESEETANIVSSALAVSEGTVIIDAGGLGSIASELDILKTANKMPIITPHPGEMAKLLGVTAAEIDADREDTAKKFAQEYNTIVVLKGHHTLIATPRGDVWQNATGNAGLARGGSGDVLAGIITGICAQGVDGETAALCAVYLHGLAADLCAARLSMQGMLPEDILTDLCNVFKEKGR